MPTFYKLDRFLADYRRLDDHQRTLLHRALEAFLDDLHAGNGFRKGLRVKGVRGKEGVFEMTWASDGRMTFAYGESIREGEPHIIWRRVGTHEIFKNP